MRERDSAHGAVGASAVGVSEVLAHIEHLGAVTEGGGILLRNALAGRDTGIGASARTVEAPPDRGRC